MTRTTTASSTASPAPDDRATETFSDRGYGAMSELPRGRWAAVVVDFQRGLTEDISVLGTSPHVAAAVARASGLLDQLRDLHVPVIHTVAVVGTPEQAKRWRIAPLGDFLEGSPFTEVDPRVLGEGDQVLPKEYPSAFFSTPLLTRLRVLGVENVALLGCMTSGCVRATAVDAFSHGLGVAVVADACGDQAESTHRANLGDVGRRYASITSSQEFLDHLARPDTAG